MFLSKLTISELALPSLGLANPDARHMMQRICPSAVHTIQLHSRRCCHDLLLYDVPRETRDLSVNLLQDYVQTLHRSHTQALLRLYPDAA